MYLKSKIIGSGGSQNLYGKKKKKHHIEMQSNDDSGIWIDLFWVWFAANRL